MSNNFGFIDIILLAMIAGFIILRLRNILGRRTGHDGKNPSSFDEKKYSQFKPETKVVPILKDVLEKNEKKEFLKGAGMDKQKFKWIKKEELKKLLPSNISILSLTDINCYEEIEETGTTLEENAKLKANFIKYKYGLDCFADDSGLEVDALVSLV